MVQEPSPSDGSVRSTPRDGNRFIPLTALAVVAGLGILGVLSSAKRPPGLVSPVPAHVAPISDSAGRHDGMAASAPPVADPQTPLAPGQPDPRPEPVPQVVEQVVEQGVRDMIPEAVQQPERLARAVPLPVPRPPEFRRNGADMSRRADRSARRAVASPPPAAEDTRSFFERLFGAEPAPAPALAYAALERNPVDPTLRPRLIPVPVPGGGTAVYDIGARIVHLPNGERLEAHSGLGETMDDPRNVHLRMRGATPPGTYDLTEREQPFHGVRALRLNPVGGAGAVYGRAGLLAHTYMLGPSGASNGCVSFKDYERFLQAYLRGEIARLVVVAGGGQDVLPIVVARGAVRPGRTARLGGDT